MTSDSALGEGSRNSLSLRSEIQGPGFKSPLSRPLHVTQTSNPPTRQQKTREMAVPSPRAAGGVNESGHVKRLAQCLALRNCQPPSHRYPEQPQPSRPPWVLLGRFTLPCPNKETQAPRQEVTCPRSHTHQGEALAPTPTPTSTQFFPEKRKLVVRGFRGEK